MAAFHPAAPNEEAPAANPIPRVTHTKIFVRAMRLEAYVGVYAHEQGRTQPLVVDVELDVAVAGFRRLEDTLNYETIVATAKALAAEGHIGLVESFAERLAGALLADQRVTRARVRVEKPEALAPAAAAAGVEIIAVRS
jgi:dihydroneopterin aldolase